MIEKIVGFYDDYGQFGKVFANELVLAFQKIAEQAEQGKTITPYDHVSSVFIDDIGKTLKFRVYWSETQIFFSIIAES